MRRSSRSLYHHPECYQPGCAICGKTIEGPPRYASAFALHPACYDKAIEGATSVAEAKELLLRAVTKV